MGGVTKKPRGSGANRATSRSPPAASALEPQNRTNGRTRKPHTYLRASLAVRDHSRRATEKLPDAQPTAPARAKRFQRNGFGSSHIDAKRFEAGSAVFRPAFPSLERRGQPGATKTAATARRWVRDTHGHNTGPTIACKLPVTDRFVTYYL